MKIVSRIGAGLAVAAFGLAAPAPASEDATAFMINPAHDGNVQIKKFRLPLKLKWSKELNGEVSYPVIANGKVYVTTNRLEGSGYGTTLYALDLHNGDVLWTKDIQGTYFVSSAVYDRGQIFVLNHDGQLRGFDGETGTPGIDVHLGDEYSDEEPPVADRGIVYASEQGVYAIDEETGNEKWHQYYSWGSLPALGGKDLFTNNGWLYSTSAHNGKTRWHQEKSGGMPAFYKGRVYTTYGTVTDAGSGDALPTLPASDLPMAFWSDKGIDYRFSVSNGKLVSINTQTGQVAWTFSGDSNLITAPIVINDRIAIGSSSDTLYLVDAPTGVQRWSHDVPAGISATGDFCCSSVWIAMGAGDGALVIPGGNALTVFVSGKKKD